jgi:hypothetical protein
LKNIRLTAPGFDPAATADKTLAIVLKNDGYCFCVGESASKNILAAQAGVWPEAQLNLHPNDRLLWLLQEEALPGKTYSRVVVALASSRFTLVPAAVYQDGTGTDYYESVHKRSLDEQLNRDSLKHTEAELIYGLAYGLLGAVRLRFPSASIRSLPGVLTEYLYGKSTSAETIFVQQNGPELLIWAYKKQKLQLLNCLYIETPEDILYHCLNTRKQLSLEQAGLVLLESGEDQSGLLKLLASQFSSCTTLSPGDELSAGFELAKRDKGAVATAFALLCVS